MHLLINLSTHLPIPRRTVVLAVGEGGQVRLEELPWFSSIMRVFAVGDDTSVDCRKLMSNIASIIMEKFPGIFS